MKNIKKFVAFTLLVTSTMTAFANDYALTNTYPLLNDMKMAKQEKALLDTMRSKISDRKSNHKDELLQLKKRFSKVISGLLEGDKKLNLKGTKIVTLKKEIEAIQLLWSHDNDILNSALNNKMYEEEALETLDKRTQRVTALNELYRQSYARYKRDSIMKSLVSSYMKTQEQKEAHYALNMVK